jgi:hypothetical protein
MNLGIYELDAAGLLSENVRSFPSNFTYNNNNENNFFEKDINFLMGKCLSGRIPQ